MNSRNKNNLLLLPCYLVSMIRDGEMLCGCFSRSALVCCRHKFLLLFHELHIWKQLLAERMWLRCFSFLKSERLKTCRVRPAGLLRSGLLKMLHVNVTGTESTVTDLNLISDSGLKFDLYKHLVLSQSASGRCSEASSGSWQHIHLDCSCDVIFYYLFAALTWWFEKQIILKSLTVVLFRDESYFSDSFATSGCFVCNMCSENGVWVLFVFPSAH